MTFPLLSFLFSEKSANRKQEDRLHPDDGRPQSKCELSHPRAIGWVGTTALAMGGSNQSLFLIATLFAGQENIVGQGSAAVPLLFIGLLVSYMAMPGWLELVMMYPNRVGGIAAVCTEAFRPYSPLLSALAGVCYWWGWVPACGVTALLAASAIQTWCLPMFPIWAIACVIVTLFCSLSMFGMRWITRLAIPLAVLSALLAFISMLAPIMAGAVDWHRAMDFHLVTPFDGEFGKLTAVMAGLYLIGFGAPAFEAATCHVGETIAWRKNVPRAMFAAAGMAAVFFCILPAIWLGTIGPHALGEDLSDVLGPTFAPLFGSMGKAAAIGFMIFNMLHGTLQPLVGASRTLAQLSEDGVLPRALARRLPSDAPWVAVLLTTVMAILFLLIGDPIWLIAAANFTYLIGICMPSVAVWLLRRDAPNADRHWRAPRGTIGLGLAAACIWGVSALFGFQQFGLPTVVVGLLFAYSGSALYAWRKIEDNRLAGRPSMGNSLHLKLAGAMFVVLALDATGYLIAVTLATKADPAQIAILADIFVAVAGLTVTVGIVLPGIISHSMEEISNAARKLATGTVRDFALAMDALGRGDLKAAHATFNVIPVVVRTRDELGMMARAFNLLQQEVKHAAVGLDGAREGLSRARQELIVSNATLQITIDGQKLLADELRKAKEIAQYDATHDPLTGLPNRTLFLARLSQAISGNISVPEEDCAVLFIDLDRFKMVNDSLGHLVGNSLLQQVAARLSALLQERTACLILPPVKMYVQSTIARLSGDEFTILLTNTETVGRADIFAEQLQRVLDEPFIIETDTLYVTASIGIVPSLKGYVSTETVLRDADIAMYRAKHLGKARAVIFESSMHLRAQTRLQMEANLRRALVNHEFELYYQPIVALSNLMITGMEALVRWNAPGIGMISPDQFIGLAEETGLIIPLGNWIFQDACETTQIWHRAIPERAPVNISINISARQFVYVGLGDEIHTTILNAKIDPATVTVEITESCTMGDPERAIRVLKTLKALGVHLSVDDFGTGYSSLSYLHRFPIDALKIDRSFVRDLNSNTESRQVVKAILALGKSMGMKTIAEGIETVAQLKILTELGCDFGQGYLFSRPLPKDEAEKLLRLPHPFPEIFPLKSGVPASNLLWSE